MRNEKFIAPYIEFINENFETKEHLFMVYGNDTFKVPLANNVVDNTMISTKKINFFAKIKKTIALYYFYFQLFIRMKEAKKIIIHGLFDRRLVRLLALFPMYLSKSYWVIWGKDLYKDILNPPKTLKQKWRFYIESKVKKNIAYYVTYLKGDYDLAKKQYSSKSKYCECIMYISNIYSEYDLPEKKTGKITILVGNSSELSNNHNDIFDKLIKLPEQNFNIICPLSYGPKQHADKIILLGKLTFGERFTPLTDFMPFNEYLKILADVDIAIFAHKRQQAMGNIITLLGLGKTVYMRNDITPFSFFKTLGIDVFNVNALELELLDEVTISNNKKNIKQYFSKVNLVKQSQNIF